jgi:hypothetical protein
VASACEPCAIPQCPHQSVAAIRLLVDGYDAVLPMCQRHADWLCTYVEEDANVRLVDCRPEATREPVAEDGASDHEAGPQGSLRRQRVRPPASHAVEWRPRERRAHGPAELPGDVRFQVLAECHGPYEGEASPVLKPLRRGRVGQRNQTVHLAVPDAGVTLCCMATNGLAAVEEGGLENDGVPWCWVCRVTARA